MAGLEDILAASKILADNSDNLKGGSGSIEKRNWDSDEKQDYGSAAAAVNVTNRIVETETVGEFTFDRNNCLGKMEKEKTGIGDLSSESNGGSSDLVKGNDVRAGVVGYCGGVPVRDEKIQDREGSCTDNGGSGASDCKKMNVTGRKSLNAGVEGCEQGNGEKLEDWEHGFRVGDFVWGKIKSHPWWPGQVYDLRDASEFAMKHRQEGRLLVAFFGDGSCSWCLPSQLKPFLENFKEMSVDSNSKSFNNAIWRAVDEIGRLLESEMTCRCVPLDKRDGLARPLVSNAGVKAGILAPEVDIRRLSVPQYKPTDILSEVMHFAKAVSIDRVLEFGIVRSLISALYRAEGCHPLPIYCEPLHIEGMEDNNKTSNEVSNDFSVPIEVPILGPLEDELVSSPTVNATKSQVLSDDKIYHRRKQKSVAELMGEKTNVNPKSQEGTTIKDGKGVGKSTSSKKRKKSNDGEVEKGRTMVASSTVKMGKKRKVEVFESRKISTTSGTGDDLSGTLSEKPKKIEVCAAENTFIDANEEAEMGLTPRERKRSKYLCPPYTNPGWRMGNSSSKMQKESDKISKVDQVGEHIMEASGDLCASAAVSKIVDKSCDEKMTNGHLKVLDTSVKASPRTVERNDKLTFAVSDVNVPIDELLVDIRFAAIDSRYLSKKGSLDVVWAFVSALRSSTYLHGLDYKVYQNCKTGRKRKSLPSRQANQEHDLASEKDKAAKRTHEEQKTARKPNASRSKRATEISHGRSNSKKLEENASSCLFLTFAPEFPLPSEEEIVRLFSKFGSLNEKETHLMTDSHSARIVYMKDSDAEAAFKSSISQKPFGADNVVNYWLQHSPAGIKSSASHSKIFSRKRAHDEPPRSSQPPADDSLWDVQVIRQKVDIMTAILENYHSKFSLKEKSGLKDEMINLLENVETVSEKVQVMAEKSSCMK